MSLTLVFLAATVALAAETAPNAVEPRPLRAGDRYRIHSKEDYSGDLQLPEKPGEKPSRVPVQGTRVLEADEEVLPSGKDGGDLPDRVMRHYRNLTGKRRIKDQDQKPLAMRKEMTPIVVHRGQGMSRPWSPRGPLRHDEIDTLLHHVFVPALNGLLPPAGLEPGKKWKASSAAVEQIGGYVPLESGDWECERKAATDFNGKPLATIYFHGRSSGLTEEGRAVDEIDGWLYVDQATGVLHSVDIEADRTLKNGKNETTGRLKSKYQLSLRAPEAVKEFTEFPAAASLPASPSAEQTAVLYEFPPLGLSLEHPRRWTLSKVEGTIMRFEHRGNWILLNAEEDEQTPSAAEYAKMVDEDMKKNGHTLIRKTEEPREKSTDSKRGEEGYARLGVFEQEAKVDGTPMLMQYWMFENGRRGVTLSAWLKKSDPDLESLAGDAAWIIKKVKFLRPTLKMPKVEEKKK